MTKQHHDIVVASDFRRSLSSADTVASQLRTFIEAGYRTGILQLAGTLSDRPAPIHNNIKSFIDEGRVSRLDPEEVQSTKLVIATDPRLFIHRPRRTLKIDAQHRVVLVSQETTPTREFATDVWPSICRNAADVLGGEIFWAPVSPMERDWLNHLDPKPHTTDVDWLDGIDSDIWRSERKQFQSSRPVIGGTVPAYEPSWQDHEDNILSYYPDDPRFMVRIVDSGSTLRDRIDFHPRNWSLLTSDDVINGDFLASIDFYVQYSSTLRLDPLLLKAMSSGAVAILPPCYEEIFGSEAVYAAADQIKPTVLDLHANRARYLAASERGQRFIARNFSPSNVLNRIENLIGPPLPISVGDENSRPVATNDAIGARRRVLFITINGVGMGHLTRMLAIAKRCPEPIEPIFLTMSQALKVLRQQGYLAEYIPSRQYLGCDHGRWNGFLEDEINELISFYDPSVVVFDGNVPYQGLIEATKANPDPWFLWSRRGMWRVDNLEIAGREKYFDAVLEPGDLAATDDHGITTRLRDRTHHVKPIRLLDSSEMLPREEACLELGLKAEGPNVLIQLGAGNNFDYRMIHKTAIGHIEKRHGAQIAVGEWLISEQPIDLHPTIVRMPGYPFARYFKAFDLAISAVGYNSFHELLFASIPTILIPNEAMEQDNQLARALYADRQGFAVCVRAKEVYRLTAKIDQLFDPLERERIKSKLSTLDPANGAAEAAAFIEDLTFSRRVDRP